MRTLILLLIFTMLPISLFSETDKNKEQDKQIEQLKKELKAVRKVLRRIENSRVKNELAEQKKKIAELNREIEELKYKLKKKDEDISFSGFFDVTASEYSNNPNIFDVGDFELDIEKSFGSNFQVGAALTFNKDGADLAVGFIDFHLFGGSIPARGRLFNEKGFRIQVGKFDIPFGNDWLYFASVDRRSVNAPLTTDIVMEGGLNDTGIRALRGTVYYNLTLHVLKGTGNGISYGGRVGLTPFNNPYILSKEEIPPFEIGFSYLRDNDKDGVKEDTAWALDLETTMGNFSIQSEYVNRHYSAQKIRRKGYHLSLFYTLKLFSKIGAIVYSRYEWCESVNAESTDEVSAITAGVNVNMFDISHLKFEYRHFLKDNEENKGGSFYAQLVITF